MKIETKDITTHGFELVLVKERDFLSVALTAWPQCLIYHTPVAH